jgi:hypothetical protein
MDVGKLSPRYRQPLYSEAGDWVMQAELKVRELTVGNRLLKTQLADNTLSFKNALETTYTYLLEGDFFNNRPVLQ